CVRRSRYRDALQVRRRRDRELGDHPTVRQLVEDDDAIAVVVRLAAATKARPKRVGGKWACRQCSRGLVEYGVGAVHLLHILGSADRTIRVRWSTLHGEP